MVLKQFDDLLVKILIAAALISFILALVNGETGLMAFLEPSVRYICTHMSCWIFLATVLCGKELVFSSSSFTQWCNTVKKLYPFNRSCMLLAKWVLLLLIEYICTRLHDLLRNWQTHDKCIFIRNVLKLFWTREYTKIFNLITLFVKPGLSTR